MIIVANRARDDVAEFMLHHALEVVVPSTSWLQRIGEALIHVIRPSEEHRNVPPSEGALANLRQRHTVRVIAFVLSVGVIRVSNPTARLAGWSHVTEELSGPSGSSPVVSSEFNHPLGAERSELGNEGCDIDLVVDVGERPGRCGVSDATVQRHEHGDQARFLASSAKPVGELGERIG